ncbi:MAG: TPM domain-containing protein [Flavisolibacter sp.]
MRFPWQKQKQFFSQQQNDLIVGAIKEAEVQTSGEIRVFVESHCKFVNALDRAQDIFFNLHMQKTELKNATLLYVAIKDRQVAVFGDEGIHQKVGEQYWHVLVSKMLHHFKEEKVAEGICHGINDLGRALATYFPYNKDTDKNELPDEIVFGK